MASLCQASMHALAAPPVGASSKCSLSGKSLLSRRNGAISIRRSISVVPRASDDRGSQDEWRPPSDWDKAWTTYKKVGSTSGLPGGLSKANSGPASSTNSPCKSAAGRGRPSLFKHMEQYVSRSPTSSDYPLSEETDSVRKTERKALDAWTDTRFTSAGLGIVAMMLVYMVVIVGPPPS